MNAKITCPVCKDVLVFSQKSAACEKGHSFDIAKEGYLNLLLRTGKVPVVQGDTLEMLKARRGFLEKGYYDDLVTNLRSLIEKHAQESPKAAYDILDVGCGEGYYLGSLLEKQVVPGARYYGTDISKPAIALAAKKYPKALFFVADTNTFLPFADGSIDILLNIFAPRNAGEFDRVLESGDAPSKIVEERGLKQTSDTGAIDAEIDKILAANADKVAEYKSGKQQLFGFFVGQTMKAMQGKANPGVVNERLRAKLD